MGYRKWCTSNLKSRGVFGGVPCYLEPSAEADPAACSRFSEEGRRRVVLAPLMGDFPRDNHAAFAHGYFSRECDLKFAQQDYCLFRLDKREGSRAIKGCPQKL